MEAIITIGISASGKSTFAGMIPHTEINRDDVRFGIVCPHVKKWSDYEFSRENEAEVTRICDRMIREAHENGEDIIISDTNLSGKVRKRLVKMLRGMGYEVLVYMLFDVSLATAIERDSYRRGRSVGEKVLTEQYDRLQQQLPLLEQIAHNQGVILKRIKN